LIARGQCVEQYGAGEAYLPLLEATTRLCQGPDREQYIKAMQQYAPSWLMQLPGLLTPEARALLQQRVQGTNRERMLREMAEATEQFSAQRPLIIVLEDLHWSDVATLDWLTYITRRREPARLLILGTYRPADVLASNHPLRAVVQELQGRQQCEDIRLTPFGAEAIIADLTQRFGQLTAPNVFAATLARRTGGNPLFVVNTIDYLLEQQVVTDEAGSWTIRLSLSNLRGQLRRPHNLPRSRAGITTVLLHHLATDVSRDIAFGGLHQARHTCREIVYHFWMIDVQVLVVDQVDISLCARC
jgi:hypothetical protein